jgi:RNA polymerase sigma-70 factor (ECF subfamily)
VSSVSHRRTESVGQWQVVEYPDGKLPKRLGEMSQAESDERLLERIRSDDPGAFDEFVGRYGEKIYRFGLRVCGEREDARDVFQETLIKVFESLKTLKEPRALRSWLYRVASNACLMKRRKGKFEPDRELSLEELMPRSADSATFEIPDTSQTPDQEAARNEARRAVRRAIETLPGYYRIVLVLRDMEQLSTREVAEALDLPETTVKMRLHRARLGVRKVLEQTLRGVA